MSESNGAHQLAELALLIDAELRVAVDALDIQSAGPTALRVDGLRVRMGRHAAAEGAGDDTLLSLDRYTLARTGWQLELEYSFDPRSARVRVLDEAPVASPSLGLRTAARLVHPLPCSALKGISTTWAVRLADAGVHTIGELAAMSDDGLIALMRRTGSRLPHEFRTKARLAGASLPPLPAMPVANRTLHSLITETPAGLQDLMGPGISAIASKALAGTLAVLHTTIDSRVLQRLTIGDLYRAAAESETDSAGVRTAPR